jgi:hypothetical protein
VVPFVVPFWHVGSVSDADHEGINMTMRKETMDLTTDTKDFQSSHKVKVPYLVNAKHIAEGTMLLYHAAPQEGNEVPGSAAACRGEVAAKSIQQVAAKPTAKSKSTAVPKGRGPSGPAKKPRKN